MLRQYRNFNTPEDFADEIGETMSTFEEFARRMCGEGPCEVNVTEYEAKMEKHLQTLQELFDEFRCSRGDPC